MEQCKKPRREDILRTVLDAVVGPTVGQEAVRRYGGAKKAIGVLVEWPDWYRGIRGVDEAKMKEILENREKAGPMIERIGR